MQKTNIEKMLMFPTKEGNFRQAIGLIKESCSYDPGLCVRISTRPSYDGSVEATFITGNGIVAKANAAKGSDPLPQDVVVYANEFCAACDINMVDDEDAILAGMSFVDGKLFVFGFLAKDSDEFNFECGLEVQPADKVPDIPKFDLDETIVVGQLDMAMVGDSTYGFPYIEMHRKNGVISFRIGDDHFCMATVFNNQAHAAASEDEKPKDFSIRLPSVIFNVLAKIKIDMVVTMELDFTSKRIAVRDDDLSISFPFLDTQVQTFNNAGLSKFATIPGSGLVLSIAHMKKILPAKEIELHTSDDNTIMVVAKTDRVDYNFTVRECEVHAPNKVFKMPYDIFLRTIIMSSGAKVEWSVSDDGESKFLAFFNTGLMSRKCTYSKS